MSVTWRSRGFAKLIVAGDAPTAPFVAIAAVCGIAIGPELCIAGVWFYLSAESTPPGAWHVWQLVPARAGKDASLLHSMSYNDPDSLDIIRCWFDASLGLDQRAPQGTGP